MWRRVKMKYRCVEEKKRGKMKKKKKMKGKKHVWMKTNKEIKGKIK